MGFSVAILSSGILRQFRGGSEHSATWPCYNPGLLSTTQTAPFRRSQSNARSRSSGDTSKCRVLVVLTQYHRKGKRRRRAGHWVNFANRHVLAVPESTGEEMSRAPGPSQALGSSPGSKALRQMTAVDGSQPDLSRTNIRDLQPVGGPDGAHAEHRCRKHIRGHSAASPVADRHDLNLIQAVSLGGKC